MFRFAPNNIGFNDPRVTKGLLQSHNLIWLDENWAWWTGPHSQFQWNLGTDADGRRGVRSPGNQILWNAVNQFTWTNTGETARQANQLGDEHSEDGDGVFGKYHNNHRHHKQRRWSLYSKLKGWASNCFAYIFHRWYHPSHNRLPPSSVHLQIYKPLDCLNRR